MSEDYDAKLAAMAEVDRLEAKVVAMQEALESARPIIKHAAVDGSEEAERVLDMIEKALQ